MTTKTSTMNHATTFFGFLFWFLFGLIWYQTNFVASLLFLISQMLVSIVIVHEMDVIEKLQSKPEEKLSLMDLAKLSSTVVLQFTWLSFLAVTLPGVSKLPLDLVYLLGLLTALTYTLFFTVATYAKYKVNSLTVMNIRNSVLVSMVATFAYSFAK